MGGGTDKDLPETGERTGKTMRLQLRQDRVVGAGKEEEKELQGGTKKEGGDLFKKKLWGDTNGHKKQHWPPALWEAGRRQGR